MVPRRIRILPSFKSAYLGLPELQNAIDEAVRHFVDRTNENALQVEKKAGLKGVWSFRIDRGNRAFFTQAKDGDGNTVNHLFHCGPHDDYRTVERKRPPAPKPAKKKRRHAKEARPQR